VSLSGLLDVVLDDPSLAKALASPEAPSLDLTAPAGMRPFAIAGLVRAGRTVLAVTATGREAEDLVSALGSLLDPARVAIYPSWETLPHERLSPRADTVGRRLAVLRRLAHPRDDDPATGPLDVVVAPVRSVLQPQVPGLGDLEPVQLGKGQDVDGGLDDVVRRLVDISYARVELVEKRGEFAVRGGILDVFPPTEEHPVRVEWWGDTVEDVRSFKVSDQRSLAEVEHGLWAPPCRELLLTPEVRARARALGEEHPELLDITDRIADGTPVEGMEALAPVLVDDLRLLVDELPRSTTVPGMRPREGPHPRARPGGHQPGVPRGVVGHRRVGGQAPLDLGAAAYRTLVDGRDHTPRSASVVDRLARSPPTRTSRTTPSCSARGQPTAYRGDDRARRRRRAGRARRRLARRADTEGHGRPSASWRCCARPTCRRSSSSTC
jgi:transcription-repair coupling factor (superfamily II helicase)